MHFTALGDAPLASSQNLSLSSNIPQTSNDFLVSIIEAINRIRNLNLVAEFLHKLLSSAQIVARHAWVQMMDSLELESAVEEVEPLRAVDIHCGAQHTLRERLVDAKVSSTHGKVTKRDLDMQRHGDGVTDHDESKSAPAIRYALIHNLVAKPVPEKALASDLEPAVPPCRTFARTKTKEEVLPAQTVEVETAEAEDGIV